MPSYMTEAKSPPHVKLTFMPLCYSADTRECFLDTIAIERRNRMDGAHERV